MNKNNTHHYIMQAIAAGTHWLARASQGEKAELA